MKNLTLQKLNVFLLLMVLLISFGCEKEYLQAILTTDDVTVITEATAICGGKIISDGGTDITSHGMCWNTTQNPTIDSLKTIHGDQLKEFSDTITGLKPGAKYYVRSYAINKGGVSYGSEKNFKTKGISISTAIPTNVGVYSAVSGGTITTEGTGSSIISRGICYSTQPLPTKNNNSIAAGNGKGDFTVNIFDIQKSTTYNVRAYATYKTGTFYGDVKSFTTGDGLAVLTTTSPANITNTSVSIGTNITDDKGFYVMENGIVWSTSQNPTINLNTKIILGNGIGSFTSSIANLTAGATYCVRAYATNSEGTAYGNQISFTTTGMTDIDGNVYNTVTIGTQVWMAENLKTTRYRNGDIIGTTIPATLDVYHETNPKYQWAPNGDENNVALYGRLYTWYATIDSRGICPIGWHVSTDADWVTLKDYVRTNLDTFGSLQKALEALPAGWRFPATGFMGFGISIGMWCYEGDFQDCNLTTLYGMTLNSNGLSLRCVRDY